MHQVLDLKVGGNHTIADLAKELLNFGYEKVLNIELSGSFSVSGGTVRIWPVDQPNPVLLDFFGNEIETIYSYTIDNDKKLGNLATLEILSNRVELSDRSIIQPGDYAVHEDHGIGLFRRVSIKEVGGESISYLELEYLGNNTLYVPLEQIGKISKYIGVGRRKPKLNKLGGIAWKKNYKKIYEDVLRVAQELLQLYAKRELVNKEPRSINQEWNQQVIANFQFQETNDQKKAIESVFHDLESKRPMDRLLCGDVGFGKTEVALRASVQTVANGFQVVILVPTTLLAEQHYSTFKERSNNLPINIERLSRFIPASQQSEIVKRCESGSVDILIGTHAILKKNITFKNLGLLIIDEEQKFGVKDKEKLRKYRESIDALSLTATPIPRTLFMSLSGLRDISLISSVPIGRKPVETRVELFDKNKILGHIGEELKRKGQVYYLHNQVSTILPVANWLAKELPGFKIEVAHGQMDELQLARVMKDFTEGRVDILVCSTIIENGLDLPNVNTLVVDQCDKFGLSQLYQIRGRIGRSPKKAYAFFTYNNKSMTANAVRRLKAIVNNTELGTGYNIALEDLEIRGGGNILGREQHGSMETVGLVLYSKLLSRAVAALKQQSV